MAIPTGRDSDKFMLRLPDGMRDRIRAAAEANGRSMNAEIVAALEEKYPAPVSSISMKEMYERLDRISLAGTDAEAKELLEETNRLLGPRGIELRFSDLPPKNGRRQVFIITRPFGAPFGDL